MNQSISNCLHCAVPENIRTSAKDGHWKFRRGRGVISKAQVLKRKYEVKLEIPGDGRVQTKEPSLLLLLLLLMRHNSILSTMTTFTNRTLTESTRLDYRLTESRIPVSSKVRKRNTFGLRVAVAPEEKVQRPRFSSVRGEFYFRFELKHAQLKPRTPEFLV